MKNNLENSTDEQEDNNDCSVNMKHKSNENQDMVVCPICLSSFHEQQIGLPNSCQHAFCLECLVEWSKSAHSCPVDRIAFQSIQVYECCGGTFVYELRMQENAFQNDEKVENCCKFCGISHGSRSRCCCLKLKLYRDPLERNIQKNHCIPRGKSSCSSKTGVPSQSKLANLNPHLLSVVVDELEQNFARDIELVRNASYLDARKRRMLSQTLVRYNVPLPSLVSCGSRFSRELSNSPTFSISDDNSSMTSNRDILLDSMVVQSRIFKSLNGCRASFVATSQQSNVDEKTFSKKRKMPLVQSFAVTSPQSQHVSTTGKQQSASNETSEQKRSARHSSNYSSTSSQGQGGSSGDKSNQHFDIAQQEHFEKINPKAGSRSDKKSSNNLSLKRQRILIRPVLNLPKSEEESLKPPDAKETPIQPQISRDDSAKDDDADAYNPFEPIISDDEKDVTDPPTFPLDDNLSSKGKPLVPNPSSPDPISDLDIDQMLDSQFEEAIESRKKGTTGKIRREIQSTKPVELDIGKDLDMFAEEELEKAQAAAKVPKPSLTKPTISHLLSSLESSKVKLPNLDTETLFEGNSETVCLKRQLTSSEEKGSHQFSDDANKCDAVVVDSKEPCIENTLITPHATPEKSVNHNNDEVESSDLNVASKSHRKKRDATLNTKPKDDGFSEEEFGLEIRPVHESSASKKAEKDSGKTDHKHKSYSKSPKRRSLRSRSRSRKKSPASPNRSSHKPSSRKRDRSRSHSQHRRRSSRRHRSKTPRRKKSKTPPSQSKKNDRSEHRHKSRRSRSKDRLKSRKRSRSTSKKRTSEASRKWGSKSREKRSRSPKESVKKTEKRTDKREEKRDNEEEYRSVHDVDKEKKHKDEFYVQVPPHISNLKSPEEIHDDIDIVLAEDTRTVHMPLVDYDSDSKQKSIKKKKKHKEIIESPPEYEEVYKKKKKHKKQSAKSSSDDETELSKSKLNKKRRKSDKFEEISDTEGERKSKKHKKRGNATPKRHSTDIFVAEDDFPSKSSKKHAKAKKSKNKEDFDSENYRSKKHKKRERVSSSSEDDIDCHEDIKKHKRSKKHKLDESSPSSDQRTSVSNLVFDVDVKKKKKKKRKEAPVQEHKESYKCSDSKEKEVKKKKSDFKKENYEMQLPKSTKDQKKSRVRLRENSSSSDGATPQSLEINKSTLSDSEREPDLIDSHRTLGSPCFQKYDNDDNLLLDAARPSAQSYVHNFGSYGSSKSPHDHGFSVSSRSPYDLGSHASSKLFHDLSSHASSKSPHDLGSHASSKSFHDLSSHASSKSPHDLGDADFSKETHAAVPSDHDVDFPLQQETKSPSDVVMKSDGEGHSSYSLSDDPNNDKIQSPLFPSSSVHSESGNQGNSPLSFRNPTEDVDTLLEGAVKAEGTKLQHKPDHLSSPETSLEISPSEKQIDESLETLIEQNPFQKCDSLVENDTGNQILVPSADFPSEVSVRCDDVLPDQGLFTETVDTVDAACKEAEQEKIEELEPRDTSPKDVDVAHDDAFKSKSSDENLPELPPTSDQGHFESSDGHKQQPSLVPQYEDFEYQQQSSTSDNNQDISESKSKYDAEIKKDGFSKSDDKLDSTQHRSYSSLSSPKSRNDVKSSSRKSYKHRRSRSRSRDRKRKRYRRSSSRSPSRKRTYSPRRKRSRSRDRRRPYSDRRRSRSPNRRRRSPSPEKRYRQSRRSNCTAKSPKRSPSPKKETMSKFKPIPPAQPSFPAPIVTPVQEIPATFSPQPIATISGIATVSTICRVQDDTTHDYHEEMSHHHHDHDLPSNALSGLFNTTRPALIEIPTVDHPSSQTAATVPPSVSDGETNHIELPMTSSAQNETKSEEKPASDLYSPSCPMSPHSPAKKDDAVPPPPPPPPKTQESSIDVASSTAMSLFTKLLSLPKGPSVQDERTSTKEENNDLKDKEAENVLNPTQILNIVGLKPQQDAKDAIMSIAELSKHLQLGQILSGNKKKEAVPEVPTLVKELDSLSPVNMDSIESSAVALYNRDKKKIEQQRKEFQDKVVTAAKLAIKPHYERREVSKSQYKDIMKRAVNKICQTDKNMDVNEVKIRRLIRRYVECYQQKNEKGKEKMKASADKGTKQKVDFSSDMLDSPPSPDESPLTGPDSPFEEASFEATPSLLKKKPRQIVTLPDLPLPPPPPPPRPKYMM